MNKYSIYSGLMMKLAFLFLSIVVILTGCNLSLLQRDNQNFGSLTLHISEPRFDASTILPETFDVDHYGVLLQTPANDDITAGNITELSYTITDIPVRTWTITGYAYNAAGVEVGRTAQPVEITIDSGTNTATVPIDILVEGTGIVDVSYSWTAALVDEATLTMTNYPGGGVVDISGISSIDLADGTASVNGEIGSGTYLLTWSSSINDVSHPAVREILQVYDNHTSSEVIVLDDLRFNTSPSAPTSLAAFMPDLDTINLSWTDNSDGESAYRVYRDGTLLADLTSNVTSYSDSISGLIRMPTSYTVEVENPVGSTSTDYSVPVASGITFGQTAYPISSVGSTAELSIEFLPSDTLNQFVTFDSSDSAQVSVTAEGVATLETGFGEATITATSDDGGYTASALVGYVPVMEVTAHEAVGYGIQNGYSSIDTGYYHTVITRTDDSIVSSGQGDYGQLGSGGTADRYIPGVVSGISALASVSAGGYHTLAVGDDGKLYAWGYNYYYQIGDATSTNRYSPVLVGSGYATVSAGKYHSLAVKTDGTLWAWGENASGRLGTGDTVDKSTPTQVGSVTNWSSVAAGEDHSLAVTNGSYEIGDGTYTDRNAPVQIGSDTDWVDVSAGSNFSIAIKSDGSLYAWGYNGSGRLGVGDSTSRTAPTRVGTASNWDAVSAGYDHALAMALTKLGTGHTPIGTLLYKSDRIPIGLTFRPVTISVLPSNRMVRSTAGVIILTVNLVQEQHTPTLVPHQSEIELWNPEMK